MVFKPRFNIESPHGIGDHALVPGDLPGIVRKLQERDRAVAAIEFNQLDDVVGRRVPDIVRKVGSDPHCGFDAPLEPLGQSDGFFCIQAVGEDNNFAAWINA